MTLIFKEKWKFSRLLHCLQKLYFQNPENENFISNYALFSAKYPLELTIVILVSIITIFF